MPIYSVQGPDGRIYDVEGPEGASNEQVIAAVRRQLASTPVTPKNSSGLGDIATAFKSGAVGSAKALTDVAGAENVASQALDATGKALQAQYSPTRQAEMQAQATRMKQAETSGSIIEEVKAGVRNIAEAPLQAMAQGVGSFVPYIPAMLLGPVGAALGLGAKTVAALGGVANAAPRIMGTAQGVGAVKGSIYDTVYEKERESGVSEAEARSKALAAQEYTGKNIDQMALAGLLGYVAGSSGVERLLTPKGVAEAAPGMASRIGRTASAEFLTEAPQGGQEQLASNIALQREGYTVPTFQGVAGQATQEGLTGALAAGPIGAFRGPSSSTQEPTQQAPTSEADRASRATYERKLQERQAKAEEQVGVEQGQQAREAKKEQDALGKAGEKILNAEEQEQTTQDVAARLPAEAAAAEQSAAQYAQRLAELEQAFPADYSDITQSADAYVNMFREKEALTAQPQTREIEARIAVIDDFMVGMAAEDMRIPMELGRMQLENTRLQEAYASTISNETTPRQVEMREATVDQPDVQQTNLLGQPTQQTPPATPPAPENITPVQTAEEAQTAINIQRTREARAAKVERDAAKEAGQINMFNRVGNPTAEAVQPVTELTPETIDPVITSESLGVLGIGPRSPLRKPGHGIQGLDIRTPGGAAEAKNILTALRGAIDKPDIKENIDTFLARPEFQGVPDARTTQNQPQPVNVPGASQPSVGVPSQPAPTDMGMPGAGVPATPGATATPDGRGLAPTGQPAFEGTMAEGAEPAPVTATPNQVAPKTAASPFAGLETNTTSESVVEEPVTNKELDKALNDIDDLNLDPETTKPKVKAFAKRLHAKGLINDKGLEATNNISKDKDMGPEDMLDEIRAALETLKKVEAKAKSPFDIKGPSETGAALQTKANETPEGKAASKAAGNIKGKSTRYRVTEDQDAVSNPMPRAELDGIIARVKKSLGGDVEITILDSAEQLKQASPEIDIPEGAAGLVAGETVYLFRDGITSGIEGEKTVFHELFHLGLRKLLNTPQKYFSTMVELYRSNARVKALADTWIATEEGQAAKKKYAKAYPDPNLQTAVLTSHAADEALARIAEELKTGAKVGTGQRAFVKTIAEWLAKVAEAIGMRNVAQSIRSETYTQVEKFVQQAMSAAVSAGPVNTEVGPRGSVRTEDMQLVEAIQSKIPEEYREPAEKSLTKTIASVKESVAKGNTTLKARQKLVDKGATVVAKISGLFTEGYRDAMGALNPDLIYRQAADSQKIVSSFFLRGGIRLKNDGLIETFDTENSPLGVVKLVAEFGKSSNISYEKASAYASSLLEGHRLYDLRETYDKALEESAVILERQGKNKEADAERNKKVRLHMDNADIDTLEGLFQKSPEVKTILGMMNATRTGVIDLMIAAGRLTPEQGKFWKDNAAYVPFNRIFEDVDVPLKGRGSYGISSLRNIPAMKGSLERPVGNVIDAYVEKMGSMITEAMHNNASYRVLDTMGLADFARELSPGENPKNENLTIKVYREGKPVTFEVDSVADYEAFQIAPEVFNWFITGLMPAARLLRVGVTATPMFATKQVIDDSFRAMFNSGVERPLVVGMRTLYNFPRIILHEALQAIGVSKGIPMLRQMDSMGIVGDYDLNIINPMQDLKIAAGASKRGVASTVFNILETITKASDLAARLAVFEETMRESRGNISLAQHRARELINFSRRGSDGSVRALSRVVPFMNAYAQGMDMLYRTASGLNSATGFERTEARKQFYKKALMMTSLGFMYAFAMSDDEGYKNALDHVRDSNILIPGTDKKITVPNELAFIFKSIPERLVGYYRRSGTAEEQSIVNLLGSVLAGSLSAYGTPNATPTLLKPILENMTNYSFFLQGELESPSLQRLDPSQRANSSTSELAKSIGNLSRELGNVAGSKVVEVSPIKVDNFLRGIFGLAGSTTLLMTDALINPTRPDRPLYQLPFTSLFLYDIEGGRSKSEFYDLQKKVGQADATFKLMVQTDPAKAREYLKENASLLQAAPILNNTLKQLSEIRRVRLVYERTSGELLNMTGAQRAEEIQKLKKYEIQATAYIRKLSKTIADNK